MENNEIKNNEQQSTIENSDKKDEIKPKTKLNKFVKGILIVFVVIAVLCLTIFGLYKSMVDISAKNIDKFDYDLSQAPSNEEHELTDFLSYNSKTNIDVMKVTIPKDIVYNKILGINELADNIYKEYGLKINKIGTVSNPGDPNLVDFRGDITYKDTINAYVSGCIRYEINESNGINLYLEKFEIGDGIPASFYRKFIPIKDGDFIAELSADNYEYLKYKALDLKYVSNISIDSNSLKFDYNYMNNIENIAKYKFGDQANNFTEIMKNVLPIVMEITFGENKEEFADLDTYIPYIITQIFE